MNLKDSFPLSDSKCKKDFFLWCLPSLNKITIFKLLKFLLQSTSNKDIKISNFYPKVPEKRPWRKSTGMRLQQKFLEDIRPSYGSTDTPVFDLIHRGFEARMDPITLVFPGLCAMDSSDSPLVWHLLIAWRPEWRPGHFLRFNIEWF